jgi:tetratricopeptide (TPR) repeat protein/tRNA A-37 threonylcarbamoyl transferase component Bud32
MSEASLSRSAVADRNLLCGILALQMDFLSRDALITAMHAWVLDKSKPLGQILLAQEQLSAERLQLLEALVAEHLKAHQDDPQQSLAALAASPSPIPGELRGIADEELHASLAAVGSARASAGDATVDQHPPSEQATGLRYRILRFHAKGGLGEVFVAEDQELHREVALKEIQPQRAGDPHSRGRFLLEAEITGGLEHPGIVPVYGLGTYDDGRPFYAMRFIKGDNLKQAIQDFHQADLPGRDPGERSLALRQLLRRFVDVCNAVAYAHSRGVLHRDLKPGNVMLGKYGETLVVDWGLAKLVGRPETAWGEDEETLRPSAADGLVATQMGAALGTPAYMSPEQAAGRWEAVGPTSDIYSLGATLYVLLTGEKPFSGPDKEAILQQVQRGEVVPPRRVKPAVPAALEAICLKAMAIKPEERYPTALELAADIEHWLADEPVRAYPEPWAVRARRWCQRHRQGVTGLAAALLAVLLMGGGGWWWWEQVRQHRLEATATEVSQALDEALEWRVRARTAAAGDLRSWQEALSVVKRAKGLLAGGESTAELRKRVDDLWDTLTAEEQAARQAAAEVERDRRMVSRLTEIRSHRDDQFGGGHADEEYAAAFRDYGVDLDALPVEEAAARIRQRPAPVAMELVGALDDWTTERLLRGRPAAAWVKLFAVAQKADPDPWRLGVREAISKKDLTALRKRAEADITVLPAVSVLLLGETLREAGEGDLALKWLRAGQRLYPGDVWINYALAEALRSSKPPRLAEAIGFYRAARAVRPEIGHALAHALEEAGEAEEAIEMFRELIRLQPTNARHHRCLGHALERKRDTDGAMACYREVIRLKKDWPEAHYNLGNCLAQKGQLEGAMSAFQQAIALDPRYAEAHCNLGHALEIKGHLDAAIAAYRAAIRLKPDLLQAHLNLGNALGKKGNGAGAIKEYQEALRLKKNYPEARHNLGLALSKTGDLDGAIAAYQEAIRLKKDYFAAHSNLGAALIKKGKLEQAIASLTEALRLNKEDAGTHRNLGIALRKLGQLDGAITAYREALRLKQDFPEAHMGLGVSFFEKGQLDQAIASFREAIRLKKDYFQAHYNLGSVLMDRGQLDQAIASFREALRLNKDQAGAHYNLGLVLVKKGQLDEAIDSYKEALRLKKDFPEAYNSLGAVLGRKGQLDDAIAAFQEAIRLKKDYAEAYCNIGVVLSNKGRLDQAIVSLKEALRLNKDDAGAHYNLGVAFVKKGRVDEAIASYKEALRLKKDDPEAHNNLGVAFGQKGQLDDAIASLKEALRLKKDYAEAYCNLSHALREQGQFAQALAALKRGHALGSKNPGWSLPSTQWIEHCEHLVELDRKLSAVLSGETKPAAAEWIEFAEVCRYKRLYTVSARFYREAFTANAKLAENFKAGHRYFAARAAALAGCGQGEDADKLDPKEKARWRQQARDWLRADLKLWAKELDNDKLDVRDLLGRVLQHWQRNPDLAGVRDQKKLAKLPGMERQAWQQLWAEVTALLKRAQGQK